MKNAKNNKMYNPNPNSPIMVKLGEGNVSRGFYHPDVTKPYTEIYENKVAHNTLTRLNQDQASKLLGVYGPHLHEAVADAQPELKLNKDGDVQTSAPLARDLEDGGLIEILENPRRYKITPLGSKFLAHNVLPLK